MIIDWSNRDKDGLFNYLNDVQWSTELSQLSREESWKFFKDQTAAGTEKFIPKRPRRQNNKPQWMTRAQVWQNIKTF